MNWFTKEIVTNISIDKKKKLIQDNDCCEHVNTDPSLLYDMSYEHDSFGSEGYGQCEQSYNQAKEEDDNEEVVCNDCTTKEKHIERVRKDRENYEYEQTYYNR